MKRLLAVATLSLCIFSIAGCGRPYYPPQGYAPPPPGMAARQGFDAGVAAARRDISRGRRPNVNRHPRFRNPPVPLGQPAAIFRENFRRGYDMTYRGGR